MTRGKLLGLTFIKIINAFVADLGGISLCTAGSKEATSLRGGRVKESFLSYGTQEPEQGKTQEKIDIVL